MNKMLSEWLTSRNSVPTLLLWICAIAVVVVFWNKVIPPEQFESKDYFIVFIDNYVWFIWIIYAVFAWGVYESTMIAYNVDRENDIANRCRGYFMEKDLNYDSVPSSIPDIKTMFPGRYEVGKMYMHIVEAAENQRFESPFFVVQKYSEEFVEEISKITSVQRLALQMGILGTFLGLITAFVKLYGKEGVAGSAGVSTDAIIEALSFSFGTSVAGLQCAIFLGIFLTLILRRKHKNLFENMDRSANSLLYLCHKAQLRAGRAFDVNHLAQTVKGQNEAVRTQNTILSALNNTTQEGLESLIQSKKELDTFIVKASQDLMNIYDHFSPERLSREIEHNMVGIAVHIKDSLDNSFRGAADSLKNLEDLNSVIARINENFKILATENSEIASKYKEEIYRILQDITNRVELTSGLQVREELSTSIDMVGKEMIAKHADEMAQIHTEITLLKNELATFNKSFNAELKSRTPVRILLQIGELSVNFVKSLVIGIVSFIRRIFVTLLGK